jgi:hypothetical protein
MKTERFLVACLLSLYLANAVRCEDLPSEWWLKPHRMLQTNLREIDATMDIDRYIQDLQGWKVNVVKFNVGGIVANYPTEVKYHWRNRFMKGDLTDTVLKRLHAEGIRMAGRFDVSKINEKFAAAHPDWLYVSEAGKNVNYNGQVHTCLSGGYQQEYMYEFLGEALDRYPLDAVFFNMSGYQRNDYSRNYHGICQCDNCRGLFKEYSGLDLPPTQDDGAVYRKYVEFTRDMTAKQNAKVKKFFKDKRPDLMPYVMDVICSESGAPMGRGAYYDTDKVKSAMLTMGRKQYNNTTIRRTTSLKCLIDTRAPLPPCRRAASGRRRSTAPGWASISWGRSIAWKTALRSTCSRTSIDFTRPMKRGSSMLSRLATSEWFVEAQTNTREFWKSSAKARSVLT